MQPLSPLRGLHFCCVMNGRMDACTPPPRDHSELEVGYVDRRSARQPVGGAARLSDRAAYHIEVNVRNLSSCGFMAECAAAVPIGSHVRLDVPGLGPVEAQVRWQIGARMGGMFLDPISLSRCEWTAERTDPPAKPSRS